MSVETDIEELRKRLSEAESELVIANANALAARTAFWNAHKKGIMRNKLAYDFITARDAVDGVSAKLKRLRVLLNEAELARR